MLPQLHAVKHSSLSQSSSPDHLSSSSAANLRTGEAPGMEKEADDSTSGVHSEIQWDIAGVAEEPSAPQQLQEAGNDDDDVGVGADIDWDVALEPSTQETVSDSHGNAQTSICTA